MAAGLLMGGVPGGLQLIEEASSFGLAGVKFKAEIAEALLTQSSKDHIEGSGFFGHEQNGFLL